MPTLHKKLNQLPSLIDARGTATLLTDDLIHMSLTGTANTLAADGFSQFSPEGYLSVGVPAQQFIDVVGDTLDTFIDAPNVPNPPTDTDGLSLGTNHVLESNNEYVKIKIRTQSGNIIERIVPVYLLTEE